MSYTPGPLPKPYAHHAFWPEWDQWHDSANPLPVEWDDEQPTDVVHVFTASQMQTYAAAEVARAVAAERERWLRVAEAAQAVTVGSEDQGEDFLLPSHLMASLALALDESPLAAIRADPQRLQGAGG